MTPLNQFADSGQERGDSSIRLGTFPATSPTPAPTAEEPVTLTQILSITGESVDVKPIGFIVYESMTWWQMNKLFSKGL